MTDDSGYFDYEKKLILSRDWHPVGEFFSLQHLKLLMLFFLSPIWILIKFLATFGLWIYDKVKDWPWFFIKFFVFELVLVTTDIGSDTLQGIRLSL